jgi:hypothetical protein
MKYRYGPKSFNDVYILNNLDELAYEFRYPNEYGVPFARIELFKKIPLFSLPMEWNNCQDLRFYQNVTTFRIVLFETLLKLYSITNNVPDEQ